MKSTLILIVIAAAAVSSCVTTKLNNALQACSRGDRLECARAGVYQYRSNMTAEGYASLKRGCFEDRIQQACVWFRQFAPRGLAQAQREIEQARQVEQQRVREKAQREDQEARHKAAEEDSRLTAECGKEVASKAHKTLEECVAAHKHPGFSECNASVKTETWPTLAKCLWAFDHPVEATCEIEIKQFGGDFWACVKVKNDHYANQEALKLQREAIERNSDDARRNREALAHQQEMNRAQRDTEMAAAERQQGRREAAWRALVQALEGPKRTTTTCTSLQGAFGYHVTECEQSR